MRVVACENSQPDKAHADSVRSVSVSKSVSTKSTPATAAPQPVTDEGSARGEASTEDVTAAQQRPEVAPTQQQQSHHSGQPMHMQQSSQPLAGLPQQPPQGPLPDAPMGGTEMASPNSMLPYGLHVCSSCPPPCVYVLVSMYLPSCSSVVIDNGHA